MVKPVRTGKLLVPLWFVGICLGDSLARGHGKKHIVQCNVYFNFLYRVFCARRVSLFSAFEDKRKI